MAPDGHHEDPCNVLTISFKALQRSRQTLEDFSKTYFPYIGLKLPDDLLKYLDVLVWVEATIYQLDEDNEQLTGHGGQSTVAATAGAEAVWAGPHGGATPQRDCAPRHPPRRPCV
eukprot:XP_001703777.1 predicted protein [Chlamydomonas reinhardtii]